MYFGIGSASAVRGWGWVDKRLDPSSQDAVRDPGRVVAPPGASADTGVGLGVMAFAPPSPVTNAMCNLSFHPRNPSPAPQLGAQLLAM